ncbi:hypothetical protein QBC36DRAFT_139539 [Triangularia setosa]|uniref:C2H2-type domain-containing protein n=1 Tax=Triangularia setosa TaxID=2587417 RepID=A0AAN6W8D3_9PEZI|nr:hypothetical protein QBC36DRAFT_139539 [Podospora setosa]
MGDLHNMHDNNPFSWPQWDGNIIRLSDEELDSYANQLPLFMGLLYDSQPIQRQGDAQHQWHGTEALLPGLDSIATNACFEAFSDLDFDLATTDNSTPTNTASAWTPLGWTTSPGSDYSAAVSDASFSSPSQMPMFPPSPRPLAPRPLASALPHHHFIETLNCQADQQTSRDGLRPVVTAVAPSPDQPRAPGVRRTAGRRRNVSLISAERRKADKPVKCPLCHKGHAYDAELTKHIRANHKAEAYRFGISTARFPCPISACSQTFARPDHASRHVQRKHKGHDKKN